MVGERIRNASLG